MNLEEYSQYRETLLHEQPGFAYNTYLCTIPQDFARVDLHWHDQMEIIYVKKGRGTVTAASRKYPVMAGSIMPILPGELHAIDGDPGVRMEYENIIIPLSLIVKVVVSKKLKSFVALGSSCLSGSTMNRISCK